MARKRETTAGHRRRNAPAPASVSRPARGVSSSRLAQVGEVQRSRMLAAAVAILSQEGYAGMTVGSVTSRARVSRRTFYDVFVDREDCYLAAFNDGLAQAEASVLDAYAAEHGVWRAKVRAGLSALLSLLDEEPQLGALLVVEALSAGPRVLQRRGEVLKRLSVAVHDGAPHTREVPTLTGEGVVGGVLGVIHARLLTNDGDPLIRLLPALMGVIVLAYEGPSVAKKELQQQGTRTSSSGQERPVNVKGPIPLALVRDPLEGLKMRLTYRTLRVLTVIAENPGASNRTVGMTAGIGDQGQISKLLMRLERLELIVNTTPGNRTHPTGEPNAWYLTPRGVEVQQVTRIGSDDPNGSSHELDEAKN